MEQLQFIDYGARCVISFLMRFTILINGFNNFMAFDKIKKRLLFITGVINNGFICFNTVLNLFTSKLLLFINTANHLNIEFNEWYT